MHISIRKKVTVSRDDQSAQAASFSDSPVSLHAHASFGAQKPVPIPETTPEEAGLYQPVANSGEVIATPTKESEIGLLTFALPRIVVAAFGIACSLLFMTSKAAHANPLGAAIIVGIFWGIALVVVSMALIPLRAPKLMRLNGTLLTAHSFFGLERSIDLQSLTRIKKAAWKLRGRGAGEYLLQLTAQDGTKLYIHLGMLAPQDRIPSLNALRPYVENPALRQNNRVLELFDRWATYIPQAPYTA